MEKIILSVRTIEEIYVCYYLMYHQTLREMKFYVRHKPQLMKGLIKPWNFNFLECMAKAAFPQKPTSNWCTLDKNYYDFNYVLASRTSTKE